MRASCRCSTRVQLECSLTAVKRRFSLCWLCFWNVSFEGREAAWVCCVGCSLSLQWLALSQFFVSSRFDGAFLVHFVLNSTEVFWMEMHKAINHEIPEWMEALWLMAPVGFVTHWDSFWWVERTIPELFDISQNSICSFPAPGTGLGDTSNVSDTLPHVQVEF